MIDDCPATLRSVAWVPTDANSPQPNPLHTTMQDDAHHANPPSGQIADSHGRLARRTRQRGGQYCPPAPFYWGENAPIFRRLFQEVGMFRATWTAVITALCVAFSATFNPTAAQDRRVPSSPAELRMSYAPIVQRVQPAVVNVYAAKVVQNRNPLLDDPIFRRFFGVPGQQPEQMQRSLGSGVIVDASGLVVTNVHVIEGADQVKVSLSDKREFEAEILLKDSRTDLAVLRLKDSKEKFPTLDFTNSDELLVGDIVLAIGNPFGVGQTVTHGIISALARTQVGITDYQFFIQTDAAINPGNSGGALVDMGGKLAGINTAIYSRSGGSQGIGFAIPANMVRVVVASAKSGGKAVKRPWLGAKLQAVTPEIAESLGMRSPTGALVASVVSNGPAAKAGLKSSDLITGIDGQTVDDPNAFDYRFATRPLGGTAQLDVQRGGKSVKLTVALETAPDTGRNEIVVTARSPFQGAKVSTITPAVADELRLDADTEGVVITDIGGDSAAASVGFQKGDIILAVNNQKISKTGDLEKAAGERARIWRITLVRGGQQINVTLGG
nr:probable serine protease do-like precursor [Bradyrhizobium sp. DOA9]